MRFLTMVKSVENRYGPPPKALMDAIMQFGAEAAAAGVAVESGGLLQTSAGAVLRLSDDRIDVTDGPFAEAKEVIGGYAFYNLKSKAEAVDWARRFLDLHRKHWKGWEGECEIRQVMEFPGD